MAIHAIIHRSLVSLLDDFEVCFSKNAERRLILARLTAAAREFAREQRPGTMCLDMGFAENGGIEEARKLQSKHWLTRGYTLFIAVVSWVRVPEWNKTTGPLDEGAHVLVGGERACGTEEAGAY